MAGVDLSALERRPVAFNKFISAVQHDFAEAHHIPVAYVAVLGVSHTDASDASAGVGIGGALIEVTLGAGAGVITESGDFYDGVLPTIALGGMPLTASESVVEEYNAWIDPENSKYLWLMCDPDDLKCAKFATFVPPREVALLPSSAHAVHIPCYVHSMFVLVIFKLLPA
jgi:hypothetical protein